MKAFRLFLMFILVSIVIYTVIVGMNHGWNLIPIFFGDMLAMNWPGQFNFDFMFFLLLSGLWTAWRNQFSGQGLALALVAVFFGILFLSSYLLYLSYKEQGDLRAIMMGNR